jgi:Flp pilus assembly pilin Flp
MTLAVNRSTGMTPLIRQFVHEESAQDMIEYVLLTAVIFLGCLAAIGGFSNPIVNAYNFVTNRFSNDV